jgi:hypothetical protein
VFSLAAPGLVRTSGGDLALAFADGSGVKLASSASAFDPAATGVGSDGLFLGIAPAPGGGVYLSVGLGEWSSPGGAVAAYHLEGAAATPLGQVSPPGVRAFDGLVATGADGVPWVAHVQVDAGAAALRVARRAGTAWEQVGPLLPCPDADCRLFGLAVAGEAPFLEATGLEGALSHRTYRLADGAWTSAAGAAVGAEDPTYLRTAPDGTLWAVDAPFRVVRWTGAAWQPYGPTAIGSYHGLALDAAGVPWVARAPPAGEESAVGIFRVEASGQHLAGAVNLPLDASSCSLGIDGEGRPVCAMIRWDLDDDGVQLLAP